jgi:twitching motility two-component system response regulator PilH
MAGVSLFFRFLSGAVIHRHAVRLYIGAIPKAACAMSSPRVLIVGHSTDDAATLEAVVSAAGFAPIRAATGADAIERARAEIPDVILIDVVAPPTDGYETCRDLQADVAIRHIPVIVVSTRNQKADQLWARLQGASNLLPKPCATDELVDAIRNARI